MPDLADLASDREMLDTARAVAAARQPASGAPVPCGLCHNCDEPLGEGLSFCDRDCCDDWEIRQRAAR